MSRLIFGSCSSQHYDEQPMWPVIQKRNASAFVWGGDAIYADDRFIESSFMAMKRLTATPEYLHELYQEQLSRPGYQALLQTNISLFGTFDDHDYGINNGDGTFRWKKESGVEFVKFLGFPEDSIFLQRASAGKGVYGVQLYDFTRPLGQQLLSDMEAQLDPDVVPVVDPSKSESLDSSRLVAVFVLDIRSNKSPWIETFPERFHTDTKGDFLGEEQWKWFETAIGRSKAAVNIVVNGLQVHAERFYDASAVENWSGFPRSQHRFHQALLQPNVRAPILISGDVHKAQMMRKDCRRSKSRASPAIRPIYEITTSGLTHSWGTRICGLANKKICDVAYVNAVFRHLAHFAHWLNPWTELIVDETTGKLQYSLGLNVAELEFDWDRESVAVRVLGVEDRILLHQDWSFQNLTHLKSNQSLISDSAFDLIQHKLEDWALLSPQSDDWVCVHYRGIPDRIHFAIGVSLPLTLLFLSGILPFFVPLLALRWFFSSRKLKKKKRKKVD